MTAVCAKLDHTAYAIKLRYAEGLRRWSRRSLERRPPEMHYCSLRTAFNEEAHAPVPTRRHARRDTAAHPDARPRAATSGPGRSHAGAHPARPEQSGPDPGNRRPDDAP